ncbi:hypothetical protein BD410DRAFT_887692 [Rickenella mellea]|uniref:PARP catalytic domain-containing protein n=1 Tax=Rickenella mellea TaxID=50990 RepID=A0A4Y7QDI0_9AGAM|nr:hypothetical protein BD410DRAFT_887692 [Rickenella mellea]
MSSLVRTVMQWGKPPSPKAQMDVCEACGVRPKFNENGYTHPYCGRTCAASSTAASVKKKKGLGLLGCSLPGCQSTAGPQFGGYCSDAHAKQAVRRNFSQGCIQCGIRPRISGAQCIECQRTGSPSPSGKTSTVVREINANGASFKSVVSNVVDSWKPDEPDACDAPTVHRVFEVVLPRKAQAKFNSLRKRTPSMLDISTFHSSQCVCDLGTKSPLSLCDFPSCGICCAVNSGFASFAFGNPHNTGSLGDGIYSYTNSFRADKHATSCTSSPYRVMILCNAIVSKRGVGPFISQSVRSVSDKSCSTYFSVN